LVFSIRHANPYFVFVSRDGRRGEVEVWPIALDQALPAVPMPLLAGDVPVPLDLQQALGVIYGIIGYDELIDYAKPPPRPADAGTSRMGRGAITPRWPAQTLTDGA
jgi:hypothetical protein